MNKSLPYCGPTGNSIKTSCELSARALALNYAAINHYPIIPAILAFILFEYSTNTGFLLLRFYLP
ncbi:MAG: hypothetical protein ABI760_12615 [Ferruginibacter sp.]